MRIFSEILFWTGRPEHLLLGVLLVHSLVVFRWRHDAARRWPAIGWFACLMVLSIIPWPGVLSRAMDGTGYVEAHLYGGIWRTDEETLLNILMRWQNVWLPIYAPWLAVWLAGLISIPAVSGFGQRLITKNA